MTQNDIVKTVARKTALREKDVKNIIDFMTLEIARSLYEGNAVNLTHLGRLTPIDSKRELKIHVRFKANGRLTEYLNR